MKRPCGPAMVVALMTIAGCANSHACTPVEGRCFGHRPVEYGDTRTRRAQAVTTRDERKGEAMVERRARESSAAAGDEPP
jgi:hypothetical protein